MRRTLSGAPHYFRSKSERKKLIYYVDYCFRFALMADVKNAGCQTKSPTKHLCILHNFFGLITLCP